jgi:rhodanese-related sulfurtransferase
MNKAQSAEGRRQKWTAWIRRAVLFCALPSALCALLSCKTVGISMTPSGYAEVSPQIANEMMLDSRQVVILDVRSAAGYRAAEGHVAGAISAPFDTIERQLPELLPYQNQTVLVYGENDAEGVQASKLLVLAGFRNVVHVSGGIRGWIERGYRTVNAQ